MGTGLVCALYILANFAYLSVLPFDGVANGATVVERGIRHATQDRVATAVTETIFGASAAAIMAIPILNTTVGSNNRLNHSASRELYPMSRDGMRV